MLLDLQLIGKSSEPIMTNLFLRYVNHNIATAMSFCLTLLVNYEITIHDKQTIVVKDCLVRSQEPRTGGLEAKTSICIKIWWNHIWWKCTHKQRLHIIHICPISKTICFRKSCGFILLSGEGISPETSQCGYQTSTTVFSEMTAMELILSYSLYCLARTIKLLRWIRKYQSTRPAFNNVKPKDWYFVLD